MAIFTPGRTRVLIVLLILGYSVSLNGRITHGLKSIVNDPIAAHIGRKALREPNAITRIRMVNSLRDLKCREAVKALKRIAAEDPEVSVRIHAIGAIGEAASTDESTFFRSQLSDKREIVQLAAYAQLAKLGDSSGRSIALAVLKRPPTNTRSPYELEKAREEAIAIVGYISDPDDLGVLKKLSESLDESARCRTSASWAYRHAKLVQVPSQDRLDFLIKALDQPNMPAWAYGELVHSKDPRTNGRLRQYLSEPGHLGVLAAQEALKARQ